tara:strand:+ start:275 stop:517 length:243 start_codon:yes stop_codon:yes gene_type:complete
MLNQRLNILSKELKIMKVINSIVAVRTTELLLLLDDKFINLSFSPALIGLEIASKKKLAAANVVNSRKPFKIFKNIIINN